MDINTTLKTQLNAAGSPALPTNRRALLTYTGRSRVHADSTCAHDTRRTHDNDRRARPLRGTGRRLPALLGTRRWRYRDGPWASRAPSAPCPPSDRPPARRASCSAQQRKVSLYHRPAPPLPAATPPARPPPSMGWVELSCTAGHRKTRQALSVEGWESADQWRKRDAQWNKPAPVSKTMGSSRGNAPAVGMSATTGRMPKLASRSEARMSSVLLTIALSRSAQTCNSEVYV